MLNSLSAAVAVGRSAFSPWRSACCLSPRDTWKRSINVSENEWVTRIYGNTHAPKHTLLSLLPYANQSAPTLLHYSCNPSSINQAQRRGGKTRRRMVCLIGWETSCVPPVLDLILLSDFFLRIRRREHWLAALGEDLSVWLPALCLCLRIFLRLSSFPVTACSIVHLSYSSSFFIVPSFLPLLLSCSSFSSSFLLPWHELHPWAYSFHWQFLLAWGGYKARLIAFFLPYFGVSFTVNPMHLLAQPCTDP